MDDDAFVDLQRLRRAWFVWKELWRDEEIVMY